MIHGAAPVDVQPRLQSSELARTLAGVGQFLGIVAAIALIAGLVIRPVITLRIFWKFVVPVLPLTFLISPILWRTVCPLATLNMFGNRAKGGRRISASARPFVEATGIALLFIIVPARVFSLNAQSLTLAQLIVLLGGVALIGGFFYERKAGFCNSICPILPVEKLYGQFPLVALNNPRCSDCTLCTSKGCVDLAPSKSLSKSLVNTTRSDGDHKWLKRPYGIFASSFPGFVLGFFLSTAGSTAEMFLTYGRILGFALVSLLVVNAVVRIGRVERSRTTILLAASAAFIYYWFAIADFVKIVWPETPGALGLMRIATSSFVLFWAYRAFLLVRRREGAGVRAAS